MSRPASSSNAGAEPASAPTSSSQFVEFANPDEAIGLLSNNASDYVVGDDLYTSPVIAIAPASPATAKIASPMLSAAVADANSALPRSVGSQGSLNDPLFSLGIGGSDTPFSGSVSSRRNSIAAGADPDAPLQRVEMKDNPLEGDTSLAARLRYWRYYISIAMWLPDYSFKDRFLTDVFAGLSVGAMMIPQSMAYTSIINVTPISGLATAVYATLVYFVLGNSRVLTVGPEATTSMMLGNAIMSIPEIARAREMGLDISDMCLKAAAAITLLTGICTLLFGLLRLGFVDSVFSRPVLSGFVCAVGMLLLVDQTPKMLGLPTCTDCKEEYTATKLRYIFREALLHTKIEWHTAVVAACCLGFLVGTTLLKKIWPQNKTLTLVPWIFILVVATTCASAWIGLADLGVKVIGSKASSFPSPRLPDLNYLGRFSDYIPTAVTLTILGFVQTHMINKTLPESGIVSPNRELVALGSMMLVTPFFGGYAAYGSITRSRISASVGTTSAFAILIAGIMALVTMLFLMPSFAQMPVAVPGAIVFFVGVGLIETKELVLCYKMKQWRDFTLNLAMIIVTFFFNVKAGLFFAFAICLMLVIKQQKKPSVRLIGRLQHSSGALSSSSAFAHNDAAAGTTAPATGPAGGASSGAADASSSPLTTSVTTSTTTQASITTGTNSSTSASKANSGTESTAGASYGALSGTATATGTATAKGSKKVQPLIAETAAGAGDTPTTRARQFSKVQFAAAAGKNSGLAAPLLADAGAGSNEELLAGARTAAGGKLKASDDDEDEEANAPYYEVEEGVNLHTEHLEGILIYQIDGPLFFSNAEGLKDRTRRIEYFGNVVSHPSEPVKPLALKGIVFDLTAVTSIDTSASQVIKEIIEDYNKRGVRVYIVRLRRNLYETCVAAGIIAALGEQNLLSSVDRAVGRLQDEFNQQNAAAAAAAGAQ